MLLEWFDGDFNPPEHVRKLVSPDATAFPAECALLIGTEGSLLIPHSPLPPRLLPASKFKNVQPAAVAPRDSIQEFVTACFGRNQTANNFEQVAPRTEAVLLGTVAVRMPGKTLEWDNVRHCFKNEPQANDYLRRNYRHGWHTAEF